MDPSGKYWDALAQEDPIGWAHSHLISFSIKNLLIWCVSKTKRREREKERKKERKKKKKKKEEEEEEEQRTKKVTSVRAKVG